MPVNPNPADRERRIKAMRKHWTDYTGLRTYSIPWVRAVDDHDLFYSETPWDEFHEALVEDVVESSAAETGIRLVLDRRRTRMTVSLPHDD